MEQKRNPEINPHTYGSINLQERKNIPWKKKRVSSINRAEKTEQPPAREGKWTPVLHHTQKLT